MPGAAPALHVMGNHLVDQNGRVVRLLGVNESGAESACAANWTIFPYPTDNASIDAIKSWHANAVRIPINESCWNGLPGLKAEVSGIAYQQAVRAYAERLVAAHVWPIIDLHWTAAGSAVARQQEQMPDADHAPTLWTSVANTFKGNDAVLFDLYNEPIPDSMADDNAAWTCLRDGTPCTGITYRAAGMQSLVDAVRATGATNVILVGGTQWAGSLSHWLQFAPHDPTGNLAASWHSYDISVCRTVACYEQNVAPVAAKVPVVIGETGTFDCGHAYLDQLLPWADSHGISYLAWTWSAWSNPGCSPVLISNTNGTPATAYGAGYRAHLLSVNP